MFLACGNRALLGSFQRRRIVGIRQGCLAGRRLSQATRIGIKNGTPLPSILEFYLASPGYKALLTDFKTDKVVDGHRLWSTRASTIMVDVDGYLRNNNLPTWDFNEVKAL